MMFMKKTIVIVEDDADLREFLVHFLTQEGYDTHAVETGKKALDAVNNHKPHVVILDLSLPDMQGEQVCAALKKEHPQTIVIILTANDETHSVVNIFALGADDYITKPFNNTELLARIEARLRQPPPAE